MPNTLKNAALGSLLRAPGPYFVRVPATDFGGIVDTTAAVIGTPLDLGGSYLINQSADLKSADLRIPVCPVVVAAANADTWTLDVLGVNHLGEDVREIWTKVSASSAQVSRLAMHCYSKIKSITPTAASTIGNRLRIGHCFGQRTFSTTDLAGRTAATTIPGISRRLPLPYRPKSASDVVVRYIGTEPECATVVGQVPITSDIAYAATTATISVAYAAAGNAIVGDVAYTIDGYAGIVTAATTTVITCAGGWVREGVAGTPANTTGAAAMYTALTIMHYGRQASYNLTSSQGGLIPGHKVLPLAGTGGQATEVAGVHLNSATFGYLANDPNESQFDSLFEVTVKVGAAY